MVYLWQLSDWGAMSRHSKHSNDRMFFTAKERADAGYSKTRKDRRMGWSLTVKGEVNPLGDVISWSFDIFKHFWKYRTYNWNCLSLTGFQQDLIYETFWEMKTRWIKARGHVDVSDGKEKHSCSSDCGPLCFSWTWGLFQVSRNHW